MDYWLKLLVEVAVPLFKTLVQVISQESGWGPAPAWGGRSPSRELLAGEPLGVVPAFLGQLNQVLQPSGAGLDRWCWEQEMALAQQRLQEQRQTLLQLAAEQRQTTLKLPEVNKILDFWPLRLFPAQILDTENREQPLPLRIFLAPPSVQFEQFGTLTELPELEARLAQGLREFLSQHYPRHDGLRATEFLGGAWESKRFHSESSIKALFGLLKSEPTLILESEVDGAVLNFRMAYWGLGQTSPCYQTLGKLPYRTLVYESARARARKWRQLRLQLLALGKTPLEVDQLGGDNTENLRVLTEEETLAAAGIDTRELVFAYRVSAKDFEVLAQALVLCHCLVAGWMADLHHLIHHDRPPRLPRLLPDLLQETPAPELLQSVIQAAIASYQAVIQALARDRRPGLPELTLKLAQSLLDLSDRTWAKQQLELSLQLWQQQRRQPPGASLTSMQAVLIPGDRPYLETLRDCLLALGEVEQGQQVAVLLKTLEQTLEQQPGLPMLATGMPTLTFNGLQEQPTAVVISADQQVIGCDPSQSLIQRWNLQTGQRERPLKGHAGQLLTLALGADGQTLASSDRTPERSHIKIWDLATGELQRSLYGHRRAIHALAIAPDGQTLASGSHKIKLWNLQTGEPLRTLYGHKQRVYTLAIAPNGQLLASGSEDATIKLWYWPTEAWVHTFSGHTGPVYGLAISPDGRTLVSGSGDQTIKLWDLKTRKLQRTLSGHTEAVYSLTISPDGKTLISASGDGTLKLWDLATGKLLHTLNGHAAAVHAVAISADGRAIASGSADKTLKIWQLRG